MKYQILNGDNIDILKTMSDNSIDSIVTDPPYGIDFLGKNWDANTGALETYQECLRVLKPGGHLLAFSAPRTYHHLAVTLEQAGFEIRDQIMWIYSSGFPKSQDIGKSIDSKSIDRALGKKNNLKRHDSVKKDNNGLDLASGVKCPKCNKDSAARYDCQEGTSCGMIYKAQTPEAEQWLGWGTALKPAHEPIALARKPLYKNNSIVKNVQEWGVGALNIDATRVSYEDEADLKEYINNIAGPLERSKARRGDQIGMFEGKTGFKAQRGKAEDHIPGGRFPSNVIGEITEPYQKYFYCPKVSRQERHTGFEDPGPRHPHRADGGGYQVHNVNHTVIVKGQGDNSGNNHPTVKPIELMKYLIKLVTPPGGLILDPFNGSGSTGMAAVELGHEYIGIEQDANYCEIAKKRIEAHFKQVDPLCVTGLFE